MFVIAAVEPHLDLPLAKAAESGCLAAVAVFPGSECSCISSILLILNFDLDIRTFLGF